MVAGKRRKLVEPGWHDGSALTAFSNEQLATGAVHFRSIKR